MCCLAKGHLVPPECQALEKVRPRRGSGMCETSEPVRGQSGPGHLVRLALAQDHPRQPGTLSRWRRALHCLSP